MDVKALVTEAQSAQGCLSGIATKSGRRRHPRRENAFEILNGFAADEIKLLGSKSSRNGAHKTQVFTAPTNTAIRTRMSHTMEVVMISVAISEMLGLNTSLARAIALGHDIGHVPFGHAGENFLKNALGRPQFCHEKLGVIIAQRIERSGDGLNLCWETLEGMMRHSGALAIPGMSPEAWVVRYADKIAYLFADYNDIQRMGYAAGDELRAAMDEFGADQRERNSAAMCGLIIESREAGRVKFDESEVARKFARIRMLMYKVYHEISRDPRDLMEPVLDFLAKRNEGDPFMLLSLMTDKDVLFLSRQDPMSEEDLRQTAISEIFPHLGKIGKIDLCDPGLGW